MRFALRHTALGLFLITVASSILLVSDWGRRNPRDGSRHSPAADPGTPGSSPALSKIWRVNLIEFSVIPDVEEAEDGVLTGLRESGLVEGRDYTVTIRNAQGDIGTLNGLVDAAITERADLLITLSTPALQVAIQRARRMPIVFALVASGIAAGAGRTNEDHLPNVTGVSVSPDVGAMIDLLQQSLPAVRTIGTLYSSSEANSVFHKDNLIQAARQAGIEVVTIAVSSTAEVADAALALTSRNVDALCQVSGSLIAPSFPSIVHAAERAKLPLFGFQSSFAQMGAAVVLTRDYWDGGRESGLLAARVMRGENPAQIPFEPMKTTRLLVNPEAARRTGFTIPPAVMQRATAEIEDSAV